MRGWRVLGWLVPGILAIAVLMAGTLLYASHTEKGTRSLWQIALMLSGGRLSGALDGGTLASGLHVQQLAWRAKGKQIYIDRIDGQWGFARKPWRLKVDWLRIGTVDAHFAPTPKTAKTSSLPSLSKKLALPCAFEILELRVDRLRLHQVPPDTPHITDETGKASASVTEFSELAVRARSNRDRHQLTVEQLITPFGELKGEFQLDARQPFALTGTAHFLSRLHPKSVWPIQQVHLRLSGSLEQMIIDVDALGAKLVSHARIEITPPFSASSVEAAAELKFKLYDSVYAGLPLTGSGIVQLGAERVLLNSVQLSIAGNTTVWQGSLGQPGDQLLFELNAPHLERLAAFYSGLSGRFKAKGHLSGHFAKPNIVASYQAASLGLGQTRIEQATGQIEMHEAANSALVLNLDGRNLVMPGVTVQTLKARVAGTRERHRLTANAVGQASKKPFDLSMAAHGSLQSTLAKMSWHGTLTQFENRGSLLNVAAGLPILRLVAPVAISIEPKRFSLGAMQLEIEQAMLDLRALVYEPGLIRSAGTLKGIDASWLLRLEQALTGKMDAFKTDLVLDGDWDFSLGERATGYLQLMRRTGDVRLNASRKFTALGLDLLSARVDLSGQRQAHLSLRAHAARLGVLEANLHSSLSLNQGQLSIAPEAPLSGRITASLPSLKTMSALLGPQYVFEGRLAMDLTLAGQIAKPKFSGLLSGDDLAANLLDDEIALTRGIVRIALSENRVDFRQVEFHGVEGTLRILGSIALDHVNPALSAKIVADKFELFATPDKQLSLSGQAVLANHDAAGGLAIDGDFKIDHALFDLPATSAPKLGDDVVIIRANDELAGAALNLVAPDGERSAGRFLPAAKIHIDLGRDFRFHGAGADLKLRGKLGVTSEFNQPLHAVGDIRVAQGSTYEAFGRKLAIENGYFGFNGPIANPSINVLAMRRNQEVEVGVQVSGTLRMPNARLVSEPNLPDSEKISWLLFGHGSSDSMNLGQTNTAAAAFALLGGVGGKRIAQTIGLDEFSIGQSEAGLTDPQVANLAKALNERFVLGYEQGLTTAASIFKATWQFSRSWSLTAHTGTLNGIDLLFNRRFD
ncbi:translocation/assembly module TamB domain-containing protein [Mycoavidus sp. HKI]|uniref:translocation/assembly module TamB domain-containing protein n=1 Tax=Mycoavidus sp. HKI TaxID=2840467 RepID=UPI00280AAD88|nr:translocation/assembly module TamB domain-containing protein [Mycoavidus sp. HKI]